MINDPSFLKKLARIKEIPTLPEVMEEVLVAITSEDSSARDLAAVLSNDQALCSKILRIANSAFFAQSRRIFSIDDSVVLLGFDSIARLALATSVFTAFSSSSTQKGLDLYGFWKHSVATAIASKMIAGKGGTPEEEKSAYTAGLLHDIGKLMMVNFFSDMYAPVREKVEKCEIFMYDAEKEVLGFTHCDIAEWLCDRWNFPRDLVRSITGHHMAISASAGPDRGAGIVRLANILCNRLQMGDSGNRKEYSLDPADYSALGLDENDIAEVQQGLEKSQEEIESILQTVE